MSFAVIHTTQYTLIDARLTSILHNPATCLYLVCTDNGLKAVDTGVISGPRAVNTKAASGQKNVNIEATTGKKNNEVTFLLISVFKKYIRLTPSPNPTSLGRPCEKSLLVEHEVEKVVESDGSSRSKENGASVIQ